MVVQHNLRAMNSNRMLGITQGTLSKSTEKLSSGYKVNRAADDAAGLSISEKMRKQIRGLTQASLNAEDGISSVQTAEGALTEVHDMLQRMNELAVKAANGTNSLSDRQTIQDEVDQLLTEIDRVAETTKFNETYLLKGEADKVTIYASAKDAGIEGKMTEGATSATFVMNALKLGDTITIGGTKYTIGTTEAAKVQTSIGVAQGGEQITVNGIQYTVAADDKEVNVDKNVLTIASITAKITSGSTAIYNGKTYKVMTDELDASKKKDTEADGIDDVDATIITTKAAYKKIQQELRLANTIGTDATSSYTNKTQVKVADAVVSTATIGFAITKGTYQQQEALNFSLHVGADADMTNKISVRIDAMDTAGLGIKGLNVKDTSGASATYAIDAIADAVAKVSAQRSLLGAVQNRLEHTINNLDNVVENTTAAESQIRDTDMATEMVKYSNNNVLAQAGQSMLAQSNQANQGVL
ncbi:MAG: flagellar hook protein, partial [Lachnospiraceae bacterium]|nr:flagellar hook protein [Lachnospiraceae bacterium]